MKCFNCRARIRCFYSKGAFLVLLWTTLFTTAAWLSVRYFLQGIEDTKFYYSIYLFSLIPVFASAPLAGWMADLKLGNYGVFRIGSTVLFASSVLGCAGALAIKNVDVFKLITPWSIAASMVVFSLGLIGSLSCLVTDIQLGLDQMPDASAENITSFIAWFVCSMFIGVLIAELKLFSNFLYLFFSCLFF